MLDTEISHLLRSNDPAQDHEIPAILSAIATAEDKLKWLDSEIACALDSLELQSSNEESHEGSQPASEDPAARLSLEREQQETRLVHLRGALSSLRRFPQEILTLIFAYAVSNGQKIMPVTLDAATMIWRLGQVCRWWRVIVTEAMQSYWSSIIIDVASVSKPGNVGRLLELCLQRSGTSPLTICFKFRNRLIGGADCTEQPSSEDKYLNLLIAESERWEVLELDSIPVSVLGSLVAVRGRVPLLRRLIAQHVPMNFALDTPSTTDAFEFAPKLEHFSLTGYLRPSRFQLPWSQLVSYEGTFRDARDFFIVMTCADNLIECDVFLRNIGAGSMIEHMHLRMLQIRGGLECLTRLSLPVLEKLIVDDLIIEDLDIVSTFIRRTPSLTRLHLYIPHENGAGNTLAILSNFLKACENVVFLVLRGEFTMSSVCSLLTISDGSAVMPNLRALTLSVLSSASKEFTEVLSSMVESRRLGRGVTPLMSLTLLAARKPTQLLERLEPYREGGLELKIKPLR